MEQVFPPYWYRLSHLSLQIHSPAINKKSNRQISYKTLGLKPPPQEAKNSPYGKIKNIKKSCCKLSEVFHQLTHKDVNLTRDWSSLFSKKYCYSLKSNLLFQCWQRLEAQLQKNSNNISPLDVLVPKLYCLTHIWSNCTSLITSSSVKI